MVAGVEACELEPAAEVAAVDAAVVAAAAIVDEVDVAAAVANRLGIADAVVVVAAAIAVEDERPGLGRPTRALFAELVHDECVLGQLAVPRGGGAAALPAAVAARQPVAGHIALEPLGLLLGVVLDLRQQLYGELPPPPLVAVILPRLPYDVDPLLLLFYGPLPDVVLHVQLPCGAPLPLLVDDASLLLRIPGVSSLLRIPGVSSLLRIPDVSSFPLDPAFFYILPVGLVARHRTAHAWAQLD